MVIVIDSRYLKQLPMFSGKGEVGDEGAHREFRGIPNSGILPEFKELKATIEARESEYRLNQDRLVIEWMAV
jgi:hypothetical protein